MQTNVGKEIAALQRMTARELRQKYAEVFGEQTNGHNRAWLVKRIAWRMQVLAEGDLSERARHRAEEIANDADLRTTLPRLRAAEAPPELTATRPLRLQQDGRLPPPGTVITRW